MLEDMGYARTTTEEGGKKVYEITPEGKAYLAEHRNTVDDIFDRIADFGSSFFGAPMMEVNHAFKELARATYATAPRHARDTERLAKIRAVLERAAREIDELGKGPATGPTGPGAAEPGRGGPTSV
jgi:DNA-binding PadR family transcriptional regulator